MKKVLVTGGTVFVTRTVAEYYVKKGHEVYVLNRDTKEQPKGVTLIQSDRYDISDKLKGIKFDLVIDNAYTADEVNILLDALDEYDDYILISSSAVYPEYETQPFKEECNLAENKFWGQYGIDKINAEQAILNRDTNAYIVRPPYLYGPMDNIYREAFVFDCAIKNRKFYLPKDGSMKLHFFLVEDMCKFFDVILEKRPDNHVFNVGNKEAITIKDWVKMCYEAAGKKAEFVNVEKNIEQRMFFCFYNYEYYLDVSKQSELMPNTTPMLEGLKEAFAWYIKNENEVNKKDYIQFIDANL